MRHRGVLLSTDGPSKNVLKIKPPLVITENDVDMFVDVLDEELRSIQREARRRAARGGADPMHS